MIKFPKYYSSPFFSTLLVALAASCSGGGAFNGKQQSKAKTAQSEPPKKSKKSGASDTTLQTETPSKENLNASENSAQNSQMPSKEALAANGLEGTEKIAVENAAPMPVDVVWLIDNSSSMVEEIQNVRNNFEKFISTLGSQRDLRLALVSMKSVLALPTMTNSTVPMFQIDFPVSSTNALAIAAIASCPTPIRGPDYYLGKPEPVCGLTLKEGIENGASMYLVSEKLSSFYRKESKKVFIIVTDDLAHAITDANFRPLIETSPVGKNYSVFAFRGVTSRPNCSVMNRGVQYENLASQTGGQVFDICDTDWSANFDKLTSGIANIAKQGYKLNQAGITQILSVAIDGTVIDGNLYQFSGQNLNFSVGTVLPSHKTIEIKYQYK
jgi:hypothetical protein